MEENKRRPVSKHEIPLNQAERDISVIKCLELNTYTSHEEKLLNK